MTFIDVAFRIGFEAMPLFEFARNGGEAVRLLDENGINAALIYHSHALCVNAEEGNARALAECSAFPDRLLPLHVFRPHPNLAGSSPARFAEALHTCSGVFFQADPMRFPLDADLFGPHFDVLEAMCMPLLIAYDQRALSGCTFDHRQVAAFLRAYPGIPTVLMHAGFRADTVLYPLLEKYENLHLEISQYEGHMALEALCAHFGSQRLIFSSRYPSFAIGAAKYKVETALLPETDRANIASGNILRLMGGICRA